MPNRLQNETSPYLLQHSDNPVDWFPWGDEALSKSREENKPILLSIGYSACHWCHVMERESFESIAIANLMNKNFVCIKVDREERPDIDSIYMQAVQALTGHGGWPLTVFLTPDTRPFFGGTYFPPTDRNGMPGFTRLLEALSDAYHQRKGDVAQSAATITAHLQNSFNAQVSHEPLTSDIFRAASSALRAEFDSTFAGFGSAPKFPQTMPQEYLLRHHMNTGDKTSLQMVEQTLQAMAMGGIYDQLGGGFHRYSTDAQWLVPHFEKMLYDNALLARIYLHAYQITGNNFYRRVAEETLDYLHREMFHPEGGFYSSQDADSEGEEGKYYVWTAQEINDLLGNDNSGIFSAIYGLTWEGNFEGRNILNLPESIVSCAKELNLSEDELIAFLAPLRSRLLKEREKRIHPALDDKILTSWNALALQAFSEAACILQNTRYKEIAQQSGTFLMQHLYDQGRLLRTWKNGRAHLKGYLEDYAFLIRALISLHEATLSHHWLHAAQALTDQMLSLFWSESEQILYDTGSDHEVLVVRPRDFTDNAIPSGSSVATEALLIMGKLTGNNEYSRKAAALLRTVHNYMGNYPRGFGHWLCALDTYLASPTEVALIGTDDVSMTSALVNKIYSDWAPSRIFICQTFDEKKLFNSPVLEGRGIVNKMPTAYVCHNYSCHLPVNDPKMLTAQLDEHKNRS